MPLQDINRRDARNMKSEREGERTRKREREGGYDASLFAKHFSFCLFLFFLIPYYYSSMSAYCLSRPGIRLMAAYFLFFSFLFCQYYSPIHCQHNENYGF